MSESSASLAVCTKWKRGTSKYRLCYGYCYTANNFSCTHVRALAHTCAHTNRWNAEYGCCISWMDLLLYWSRTDVQHHMHASKHWVNNTQRNDCLYPQHFAPINYKWSTLHLCAYSHVGTCTKTHVGQSRRRAGIQMHPEHLPQQKATCFWTQREKHRLSQTHPHTLEECIQPPTPTPQIPSRILWLEFWKLFG